jgi:competence protein ComEA
MRIWSAAARAPLSFFFSLARPISSHRIASKWIPTSFTDVAMDPGVTKPGDQSRSVVLPLALLAWPAAVQIALGLIVTSTVFFLLGRWSQDWTRDNTPPRADRTPVRPAVDLNHATAAELRLLPGLGESLSQRIIEYRRQHGDFRSVDDLRKVYGIGPKTLERLRPHLFVAPPESFVSDDDGEPAPMVMKSVATASANKASKLTSPIDINHADQAELQKLPGIGPKLSQRILDERAKGPFKSIDELRRVPGIGPKTLEKVRPFVCLAS